MLAWLLRSRRGRAAALALAVRAATLAAMAAADWAAPDLSSSAHLQAFPCTTRGAAGDASAAAAAAAPGGGAASAFFDGLAAWDSAYFVRIAKCGYEVDKHYAFFPGLPAAMRAGAALYKASPAPAALRALAGAALTDEALYAAVGLALSAGATAAAAAALHALTERTLGDAGAADLAALLFAFNPASVFYSAAYTEAPFAAASWAGMLALSAGRFWLAVAAFTAASAARSNGLLNAWFLLHAAAAECAARRAPPRAAQLARTAAGVAAVAAPYAALQAHAYRAFCTRAAAAAAGAPPPAWCARALPSVYGHVQDAYWDVGFLRFYRKLVRLPRIATSLPAAYLAVSGCWAYFSADWRRALSLGLAPARARRPPPPPPPRRGAGRAAPSPPAPGGAVAAFAACDAAAPYVYHLALMTAVALLAMHVHVATRFLSACPPLYWYAAAYVADAGGGARGGGGGGWRAAWVWAWCWGFAVLGVLLYPNYMPWT